MESIEIYKKYLDQIVYAIDTLYLTLNDIESSAVDDYYDGYITYDHLQAIRKIIAHCIGQEKQ